MCLGVPARVIKIEDFTAEVDFGDGTYRKVIIATNRLKIGDIVLVHAGAIIEKIKLKELKETLELYKEMAIDLAVDSGMRKENAERFFNKKISLWYKHLVGIYER